MPMHSLIHPNRAGCLKMRAADTAGSGSGSGTDFGSIWQPESELAQLQTEVFAATGVKVSADDPIIAVLVIQKRDMQAYMAELTRRQDEQQDIFLADFKMKAQEVCQAAENLARQQQQIVNTVLKANSDYLDGMENKLLGSAVAKPNRTADVFGQFAKAADVFRLCVFSGAGCFAGYLFISEMSRL